MLDHLAEVFLGFLGPTLEKAHDFIGSAENFAVNPVHSFGIGPGDAPLRLFRFLEKLGVGERRLERRAQQFHPLGGNIRRRQERPTRGQRRRHQGGERLAPFGKLTSQIGHALERWMRVTEVGDRHEPEFLDLLPGAFVTVGSAMGVAPHDGKHALGRRDVTGDGLDGVAIHLQQHRALVRSAARAGCREQHGLIVFFELGEGLHRMVFGHENYRGRRSRAADRNQLAYIVLDPGFAGALGIGEFAAEERDLGAVPLGPVHQVIGGDDTTRAGHVDGDRVRLAGKVPRQMPGDQAPVKVIAAARAGADDDLYGLTFVEGLRRGRRRSAKTPGDRAGKKCGKGYGSRVPFHPHTSLSLETSCFRRLLETDARRIGGTMQRWLDPALPRRF